MDQVLQSLTQTFSGLTLLSSIGLLGVALYLSAYTLLQFGFLRGASVKYTLLNLAASTCVLISLQEKFNLSSAMIQISWITISIVGLTRLYFINKMMHFDGMELAFVKTKLSGLSKEQARRFLKLGKWETGHTGQVLATEGKPVSHLYYVAEGNAEVCRNGTPCAKCEAGDFIGEITYLSGQPATGTVTLTGPATLFSVEAKKVRDLVHKNHALHTEIEKSVADDLRHKLARGFVPGPQPTVAN